MCTCWVWVCKLDLGDEPVYPLFLHVRIFVFYLNKTCKSTFSCKYLLDQNHGTNPVLIVSCDYHGLHVKNLTSKVQN